MSENKPPHSIYNISSPKEKAVTKEVITVQAQKLILALGKTYPVNPTIQRIKKIRTPINQVKKLPTR